MTRRDSGHQVVPVVGLGIEALSRGVGCIDAVPLVYELVQLGKIAPVEAIDETLDKQTNRAR